jgi:diacylglycerol O-acyltransferase / trehalose O-mycolyltransferase / mycolyltransferase Ag85
MLVAIVFVSGCGTATPSTTSSPAATSEPSQSPPEPSQSPSVAEIVASKRLDERTADLTIESPAVGDQVNVRLVLPAKYQSEKSRRWPVLYLLHGCCDNYVSWTRSTDITKLTQDSDLIVAMPDGGAAGFYSDWQSGPKWETFHTIELPALLKQRYRANQVAAIAGVSMGGLGALDYAARHRGMFTVAASFSGIVHTRLSRNTSQGYLELVQSEGEDPLALWGDPRADVEIWKQHNPYDLAPQLKGVRLFISAGNGQPGPLDSAGTSEDQTEIALRAENQAFADRVRKVGLNVEINLYKPGTHNWVYWQRELHRAWPLISDGLGLS